MRMRSADTRITLLIIAMASAALGLLVVADPFAAPILPVRLPWPALAVAFVAAEAAIVRLHFRSEAHEFNLIEAPLLVGLFMASPAAVVGASVCAAVIVRLVRHQTFQKAAFNVAAAAFETAIAAVVLQVGVPEADRLGLVHWLGSYAAVMTAALASSLLVAAVIGLSEGALDRKTIIANFVPGVGISIATASVTLAAVALVTERASAVLLLTPAMLVVVASHRAYVRALDESGRLATVARVMTAMASTHGAEQTVVRLLEELSAELGAGVVELMLFDDDPSTARLRVRHDADGCHFGMPVDRADCRVASNYAASGLDVEVIAARSSAHPLDGHLRSCGVDDALVLVLRNERTPIGILTIGNRVGEVMSWSKADHQLGVALAQHAGVILSRADLAAAVSDMETEHDRLVHESHHDPLTGLVNRRGLAASIASGSIGNQARSATGRGAVAAVYIDLDDFKSVNDTHGHAVGDELLQAVARRLDGMTRPGDIAVRLGGDEFLLLVRTSSDRSVAQAVADRALRILSEPVVAGATVIQPSASIGLAVSADGGELGSLVEAADAAMYESKMQRRLARQAYVERSATRN